MDFHLSKEHLLVRKMYREFAENEVKPLAEELDEEERFPMETVEKMAKLGMMGIYFPKEYGGAGGDAQRRVHALTHGHARKQAAEGVFLFGFACGGGGDVLHGLSSPTYSRSPRRW